MAFYIFEIGDSILSPLWSCGFDSISGETTSWSNWSLDLFLSALNNTFSAFLQLSSLLPCAQLPHNCRVSSHTSFQLPFLQSRPLSCINSDIPNCHFCHSRLLFHNASHKTCCLHLENCCRPSDKGVVVVYNTYTHRPIMLPSSLSLFSGSISLLNPYLFLSRCLLDT